jgi:hypothetical protein
MSCKKIPEATPIILTTDERAKLNGNVHSIKAEHRVCTAILHMLTA